MKDQYKQLSKEHFSVKVLDLLPDFSYFHRVKLIEDLLSKFKKETVNIALFNYYEQYIKTDRVNYNRINPTLKMLCNQRVFEEKELKNGKMEKKKR